MSRVSHRKFYDLGDGQPGIGIELAGFEELAGEAAGFGSVGIGSVELPGIERAARQPGKGRSQFRSGALARLVSANCMIGGGEIVGCDEGPNIVDDRSEEKESGYHG